MGYYLESGRPGCKFMRIRQSSSVACIVLGIGGQRLIPRLHSPSTNVFFEWTVLGKGAKKIVMIK
jgi:hypothetical protein